MEKITSDRESRILTRDDPGKREFRIHVVGNGFILKTRSGWWLHTNFDSLIEDVGNYIAIIQKEIKEER